VNTPFPVRPDADCLDRLKTLDDPGKILLHGCLWPFPQPSKRGPFAVNQVRIEGTVFVGVFEVQSAGFDGAMHLQE
jgi:hypothetical protein